MKESWWQVLIAEDVVEGEAESLEQIMYLKNLG
jgi:hypothetical protein